MSFEYAWNEYHTFSLFFYYHLQSSSTGNHILQSCEIKHKIQHPLYTGFTKYWDWRSGRHFFIQIYRVCMLAYITFISGMTWQRYIILCSFMSTFLAHFCVCNFCSSRKQSGDWAAFWTMHQKKKKKRGSLPLKSLNLSYHKDDNVAVFSNALFAVSWQGFQGCENNDCL